ncbi:MAG: adenine-specific methylase [Clostridia bacterium]|nr:adenine-specific methylase [Clostridia bacterium]
MDIISRLYNKGRELEKNKSKKDRKKKGVFYTPIEIVDYMSSNMLDNINLIENPYVRVLDISCGAGYFLLKAYQLLKEKLLSELEAITDKHPELQGILTEETIGKFIVEHNLWGVDIDPEAAAFVRAELQETVGSSCHTNIICADSLLSDFESNELAWFWKQGFDIVIGNPPYIGHKAVSIKYKNELYKHYKAVYRDKADISYCFFKRGMDLLKEDGRLSFITSRYFMEGPSAAGLRDFLKGFAIEEIIDFGDSRIFSDAGVAVCIVSVRKSDASTAVRVKKPCTNQDCQLKDLFEKGLAEFNTDKALLKSEGWLLLEPSKLELYRHIDSQSTHRLDQLFNSFQGIITGCDRAFIVNREQAEELEIEKSLLKPWIKNSQIEKFFVTPSDKLVIYTDLIDDPEKYPAAIGFAEVHRDRLSKRRECQRDLRKWYKLQWGRDSRIFESPKIIYPYKAARSRFAVDRKGLFCSADIYSLLLKSELQNSFSLEYLAALLNSKLVDFYFKCFAKRISPSLFDYYPNTVLRIKLKLDTINENILRLTERITSSQNAAEHKCILQAIDREVYTMYGLSEEQIRIIEDSAGE